MRRRWKRSVVRMGICIALLMPATRVMADALEVWLDERHLTTLLTLHLEELMGTVQDSERQRVTTRLVGLYAQLLEAEEDPATRLDVEQRARQLLTSAPEHVADELRLALLRGTYRGIERVCEEHRLRLRTDAEVASTRDQLEDTVSKLLQIRKRLNENVEVLDRKLARATGVDAMEITAQSDRQRQLAAQAAFLTGWAMYYQSWLSGKHEPAAVAEEIFAQVLDISNNRNRPEDVSIDLRSKEAFARAILGMAMVKSILATSATTDEWLDLLETEKANAEVREQLPAWRMVNYLEHLEYAQAGKVLQDLQEQKRTIPVPWIRLCAVQALEAHPSDQGAKVLAQEAMALLASRGELAQVLDLANRFGADRLSGNGFATRYVRGVQDFQHARDLHRSDEPTRDPKIVSTYEAAANELSQALAQPDVERFSEPAASARFMIGQCRFLTAQFLQAKDDFLAAASEAPADQTAEALWMAIVSLDRLNSPTTVNELNGLIDRFLSLRADDPRGVQLLCRRASGRARPDPDDVDRLLAVPESDEGGRQAHRLAIDLLAQLWKGNTPRSAEYRRRFLDLAIPELDRGLDQSSSADSDHRCSTLLLARQALEASVDAEPRILIDMQRRLDRIEALTQGCPEAEEISKELIYRSVQIHLRLGQIEAADKSATDLLHRGGIWANAASVAMFNEAVTRRATPLPNDDAGRMIEWIIRYGQVILDGSAAATLPVEARLGVQASIASAVMDQWKSDKSSATARRALDLYVTLLDQRAGVADWLRNGAEVAEALQENERAAGWWRSLAAGCPAESDDWWEARTRLILLIARVDRGRGREVLDQHLRLHPEYGPEPWGSQLKQLDQNLGSSPTSP